ncbi:MarR family winged helix-turn-helix transcriptional regulator [Streptomyces fungicidicus]|jgi:DNA-binding MarR family transcriptional regulator|uniref:MarR family transcriptional regulator n=2 Tax=Streptomyces TaxID=1883 RepID=A0A494UQ26_9ACTN|nr:MULTISPECIES: MarR family winged helix-turn-helix transcriptional regulator [Streptomyces]AYL37482.1 MarR family transcriptional regulator [Streptomyces fungicidicus]QKW01868.1 winged helix-turn-helix transcriptional regulator [Streptomyces sp. NA02536]TQL20992.1 DNA-binding MarR family transcriptional regulator [Streptomyces sp. SLBN-134]
MPEDARPGLLAELAVVSRRYMAAYALFGQALADHMGLHPTDVQCLNLLTLEGGPVTTTRIGQLTGLTTGSATRLVDRLERAGYVVRKRDAADRRLVLVTVVPAKAAEFGRVWERLGGGWVAFFEDLDDAQLALFIDHMRRTTEFGVEQAARLRAGAVERTE